MGLLAASSFVLKYQQKTVYLPWGSCLRRANLDRASQTGSLLFGLMTEPSVKFSSGRSRQRGQWPAPAPRDGLQELGRGEKWAGEKWL